ncbi:MAG: ATP-dependent DNA helicase RecG [Clostridia bacterium]|nr:ATP-dependent DNA helicase RecG [Clostridia bacterium]
MLTMESPIQYVKGVGEKRAQLFQRLGIATVGDLLTHYPRQYEDWTIITRLSEVVPDTPCCIKARALAKPTEHLIRKGLSLYRFHASDGSGVMQVTLFNNKYTAARIEAGQEYLFFGTVSGSFRRPEMSSPLIEPAQTGARIRPIYPLTEGLTSRYIEKTVATALLALDQQLDADALPPELRQQYGLCTRRYALENIHFPADQQALSTARNRLVFEELLTLQLGLLRLKGRGKAQNAARLTEDYTAEFCSLLPFTMTGAQQRAAADCLRDMQGETPMNRLLQGDVGSGKTAVAACVAFCAIRGGYQCAMMAPTEILAEQHYHSLSRLFELHGGITVGLLTGSMKKSEKDKVLCGVRDGTIQLVVGTHALLSDTVQFASLGLVITDEQHRFGVRQRAILAGKGQDPHLLVMSATPIPRTLALMIYGDLDISILNELPPGRTPISTYAIGTDKRERAYGYIKKHLDEGRQAYIVCSLVEEGETDLVSAEAYAEKLAKGPFSQYTLGLLHGKMKARDKEQVMRDFSENRVSILVATTVVEVGVDVPNAVLMVIENAERFGLAQLHQLRGRVGRGQYASSCILISDAQNPEARHRLKVMCDTTDGFKIADEDLKQRGPGDFFGDRQHGLPELKIADLLCDTSPLRAAQEAARSLYQQDPSLSSPAHRLLSQSVRDLFDRVGENGLN